MSSGTAALFSAPIIDTILAARLLTSRDSFLSFITFARSAAAEPIWLKVEEAAPKIISSFSFK
jgi:hypothetical protein